MKFSILFYSILFYSFFTVNHNRLYAQCLDYAYIIDANGFTCDGTSGEICFVTDGTHFPSDEGCDDYVVEIEYNTGNYIYTELGGFELQSFDPLSTTVLRAEILLNSHGDSRMCMEGLIQVPNTSFTIRIVHQDNPLDILDEQVFLFDNAIEVGEEGETTLLSDLIEDGILLSAQEVVGHSQRFTLAGTLIIDQDYEASEILIGQATSEIIMQPNARIETLDGTSIKLGFYRNKIHGCGERWDQILINEGNSDLRLTFTDIEDADIAINLRDNTDLYTAKVNLNNNRIGISSSGEGSRQIRLHPNFSPDFSTNISNGEYGFYLDHLPSLGIHDYTITDQSKGIYIHKTGMIWMSNLNIRGCDYGIYGEQQTPTVVIMDNIISECGIGVQLHDYNVLNFKNNNINSSVHGYLQWGGRVNAQASFRDNQFFTDRGIVAVVPSSRAEIQNNDFINTSYNVALLGIGTGQHRWAIQHNPGMHAGFNNAFSYGNVILLNTNNARIFRNRALIPTGFDGLRNENGPGIVINGGRDNLVGYNLINPTQEVISMDGSPLNTLYCNDIITGTIGLKVLNNCAGAEIRGNDFAGTDRNLQYGSTASTMAFSSSQDRLGNIFALSDINTPVAKHYGTSSEADQSQYLVAGFHTQGDNKYPFFESNSDTWFDTNPLFSEYECPEGIIDWPEGAIEKWEKATATQMSLLNGVLMTYGENVATDMELKLNRHGINLEQQSYPIDNLLNVWLDNNAEFSPSRSYIELEEEVNSYIGITEAEQNENDVLYANILEISELINSNYIEWDENTSQSVINADIYEKYESDIASLASLANDLAMQYDEKEQEIETQMPAILADIQALSTDDLLPLEIKKEVNAIEVKILLNEVISMKERETLKEYAALCAAEAGEGVYQARTLLALLDKELILDYNDECLQAKEEKKSIKEQQETNVVNVNVYPNPTTDKARIQLGDKHEYELMEVQNINGVVLFKQLIEEDQQDFVINMNQWPRGIYFLQLKGGDVPKSLKLIKQ